MVVISIYDIILIWKYMLRNSHVITIADQVFAMQTKCYNSLNLLI